MADSPNVPDASASEAGKGNGKAQGGGDSSGAGNILAGVQPEHGEKSGESERRDS